MPWKESSQMSSRLEFVMLAQAPGVNMRALCRSFGVSPKTGYKLLARFQEEGQAGLQDRPRRPLSSPFSSSKELEAQVLALHDAYPCWGSRKLRALLPEDAPMPHPSTIDAILRRYGRKVERAGDGSPAARKRFEHEAPNLLWQMDFKGHFPLTDHRAGRCHALTVLDDHSRFAICLNACSRETGSNVQTALTQAFRLYGLPERITCDNGSPWRTTKDQSISRLEVWLLRLGIHVNHSRPYHPQTQGKDERFHRTLKLELLDRNGFNSIARCQIAFDAWRDQYNLIRPHEALGQRPPVTRYRASARPFPEQLPPVEYTAGDVRKVRASGQVEYMGEDLFVGEGLAGQLIAICPSNVDEVFKIFFCNKEIRSIDLRKTA